VESEFLGASGRASSRTATGHLHTPLRSSASPPWGRLRWRFLLLFRGHSEVDTDVDSALYQPPEQEADERQHGAWKAVGSKYRKYLSHLGLHFITSLSRYGKSGATFSFDSLCQITDLAWRNVGVFYGRIALLSVRTEACTGTGQDAIQRGLHQNRPKNGSSEVDALVT